MWNMFDITDRCTLYIVKFNSKMSGRPTTVSDIVYNRHQ